MSRWKTAVSAIDEQGVRVRGYPVQDLMGQYSFAQNLYLTLSGRLPNTAESRMMEAILSAVLDYGLEKPGTVAARFVTSVNPLVPAGLAASLLAIGMHSVDPAPAAKFIAKARATASEHSQMVELVDSLRSEGVRIPGLGHPYFRETDHRADRLREIAEEESLSIVNVLWLSEFRDTWQQVTGNALVINEVGMMAAVMLDMGLSFTAMTGIACIASLPGVIAHIEEEINLDSVIRTVPRHDVNYAVPARAVDGAKRNDDQST